MITIVLLVAIFVVALAVLVVALMVLAQMRLQRTEPHIKADLMAALAQTEERLKADLNMNRRDQQQSLKAVGDSLDKRLAHQSQVGQATLERVRGVVESRLQLMQKDNNEKLEVMRATVDEKLHATLERRLGESFKHVSERLEQVHKGLGEMQTLASGVGDLKKVLTNVKTRGTWGEVQLGNLLEQIMTPAQYDKNVAVKPRSNERVEFAIKLPDGPNEETPLWMPIDAKFPMEDYQRLVSAREVGDLAVIETAGRELVSRIKSEARDIHNKYIAPPYTTDFGILYLPTEGLYAEITQRDELAEQLRREHKVLVAGPNTVAALLNALQMGFRTLAIQKRSSEVWQILAAVKGDFGKFGDLLDKTQKKLQEASNHIESAATKSRSISRRLDKVQGIPQPEGQEPLALVHSGVSED